MSSTLSAAAFALGLENLQGQAPIPDDVAATIERESLPSDEEPTKPAKTSNKGEKTTKPAKTSNKGKGAPKGEKKTSKPDEDKQESTPSASVFGAWSKQKIVAMTKKATAQRDAMQTAITNRVAALESAGQFVAVEWASIAKHISDDSFVRSLALLDGAIDIENLTRILPNYDKNKVIKTDYIQAKTVQKAVRMVHAFALRDLSKLDPYQQQVIVNALFNGDKLSMRGALASLSRMIECEGMSETLKSRASYTAGTAGAQASQVRELLRVLGLGTTVKGGRDDTLTVNEERAKVLRDIFAMGVEETEAEEA